VAAFNILKSTHCMVGADLHSSLLYLPPVPPLPPLPGGPWPHLVAAKLHWTMKSTLKEAPSVVDEGSAVMQRCTDIGSLIVPHLMLGPALIDVLMPLYIATSASKSHFGASTVMAENAPVATAVLKKVNLNLNCATIVGLGIVFAPNTVCAGMTVADLVGGLVQMLVDGVANYLLGKLFGGIATRTTSSLFTPILRFFAPGVLRALTAMAGAGEKAALNALNNVFGALIGDGVGSPLGYSYPHAVSRVYEHMTNADNAATRYFNGNHPTFL